MFACASVAVNRAWTVLSACLALGLFTGCLGPLPPKGIPRFPSDGRPPAPETLPAPATSVPVEGAVPEESGGAVPEDIFGGAIAVMWTPPAKTDPLAAAQILADHPSWRVTAVLPDNFFGDDANARQGRALFQTLVSSGRVEMVMTLPGRPLMPLLMDTDNAKSSTGPPAALPPRFSWPEDVTGQIALARRAFRRCWKVDPAGVALPWDAVLGPELSEIAKFKIRWAVLPSTPAAPRLVEGLAVPLFRPALPPPGAGARRDWAIRGPLSATGSDAFWGPVQVNALEELAAWESWAGDPDRLRWALLSEIPTDRLSADVIREPPSTPDFSPWIGDIEENRAWDLLGIARRAVEEFKNSGQADLRTLDLAMRAVYAAESGGYFFAFGHDADGGRDADVKREFLATLHQVFQIMVRPVPAEIRSGFARGGTAVEAEGSFERIGSLLRWRDPSHDDRGPGAYFYPSGSQFESGSWDLRVFEVQPNDETITLRFEFGALPNPWKAPLGFSFPLVEVYIDINHSPGAGSQEFLPGRAGLVEHQDAWEYALTVDGWGARLFQYVPGAAPRATANPAAAKTGPAAFQVVLPRRLLRGDPAGWGYGVTVLGRAPQGGPMPVGAEPGPGQFGGAELSDRPAPPFIDLLTPEGVSQKRVLGVHRQGQDPTLPFVRAE